MRTVKEMSHLGTLQGCVPHVDVQGDVSYWVVQINVPYCGVNQNVLHRDAQGILWVSYVNG